VHGIVRLRELLAHWHQLHRNNLEAAILKARDHATSEESLDTIWLDEDEGAF
jgi:hypothetical protein